MDTASGAARSPLTPVDWVREALAVIAESGFHALSVDGLAKRIGVSRGSFYWHFADRKALIAAALAYWEHECTRQIISDMADVREPLERLRILLTIAFTPSEVSDIETKLAQASDDALVRDALARVTAVRLDAVQELFAQLGFPPPEAATRSRLMYATYLGYYRALAWSPTGDPGPDIDALMVMLTAR